MFENLVERTWQLGDLMMGAAKRPLFITSLVADEKREILAVRNGWAGGPPQRPSRGPYYGPWKAIEMVQTISLEDPKVMMTPVPEYDGSGYRGGVRQRYQDLWMVTTGSAWSDGCDALMALVLNFAMLYEVRFHHVGYRHESEESMLAAVRRDEKLLGVKARYLPTDDHYRYYLRVESPQAPNGVYWVEHQYFPEGNQKPGIHWDVVSTGDLLGFIGKWLEVLPETWEAGRRDPFGMVSMDDRDGMNLAVMQRNRWTNIENW